MITASTIYDNTVGVIDERVDVTSGRALRAIFRVALVACAAGVGTDGTALTKPDTVVLNWSSTVGAVILLAKGTVPYAAGE